MKTGTSIAVATVLMAASTGAIAQSASEATYQVTFAYTWTAESHPLEYPVDPHMARIFATTHTDAYTMFADGTLASPGLEMVAERGRPAPIQDEIAEAAKAGNAGEFIIAPGADTFPTSISFSVTTTQDLPLISAASMIAPSPDWFVGFAGVPLYAEGRWIDQVNIPLFVWDSGTDDGQTYAARNADTQPRESVRLSASPHFFGADGLKSVGTATISRTQ